MIATTDSCKEVYHLFGYYRYIVYYLSVREKQETAGESARVKLLNPAEERIG
ncbi:MAG: hypothetical protein ACFBSE_16840 [Prochloraceae cyanobacterium]